MEISELEENSGQGVVDPAAGKVKVSFSWDKKEKGKTVTMEGDFWFITDEGLSYAAKLKGQNAGLTRDLLEINLFVLTERVRFGEDGDEKLPMKKARELVESPNPMIEALVDAAYAEMHRLRNAKAEVDTAVKH